MTAERNAFNLLLVRGGMEVAKDVDGIASLDPALKKRAEYSVSFSRVPVALQEDA